LGTLGKRASESKWYMYVRARGLAFETRVHVLRPNVVLKDMDFETCLIGLSFEVKMTPAIMTTNICKRSS
jgi:hypothetical protein